MGFVYHSNYFIWFEVGRVHMLDEIDLPYHAIEAAGYRLPVLEAHAKFIRPACFDDIVVVEATMRESPSIRLQIDYEVSRGSRLLCQGYTLHAFVNREGKPARPPGKMIDRMRRYFE